MRFIRLLRLEERLQFTKIERNQRDSWFAVLLLSHELLGAIRALHQVLLAIHGQLIRIRLLRLERHATMHHIWMLLLVLGCHHLGLLGTTTALTLRERSVCVVRQSFLIYPNARLVAKTWKARLLQLSSTSSSGHIAIVALTILLIGHSLLRSLLLVRLLSMGMTLIPGICCRVGLC